MAATTFSMRDCPVDVWQVLSRYIRSRHFLRLLLTGDTRLHRVLRRIPGRHFEIPVGVWTINVDSVATQIAVLAAQSLTLRAHHLIDMRVADVSFPSLTKLDLQSGMGTIRLQCHDFAPLASLQWLNVEGYWIDEPLSLPTSITSVKAEGFMLDQRWLDAPIRDLERLTSLTKLHLCSSQSLLRYPRSVVWPPSMESLYICLGEAPLPRTATRLTVNPRSSEPIDVYKLVTDHCPHLTSLSVCNGDVIVSSALPLGLERLVVSGAICGTSTASLCQTFQHLPPSLKMLRFGSVSGREIPAALRHMLPRLGFADLDNACRSVIHRTAEVEACLVENLARWLDGDRVLAAAYVSKCAPPPDMRSQIVGWSWNHTAIDVSRLYAIRSTVNYSTSLRLFPLLLHKRKPRSRLWSAGQHTFEVCSWMLELGAMNWLQCPGASGESMCLAGQAIRNLVELRVVATRDGLATLGRFFECNEALVSLRRVKVGSIERSLDGTLDLIYAHRLKLPALQWVEFDYSDSAGPISPTRAESVGRLAEMRLYPKHTACPTFVYRVTPPKVSPVHTQ